MFLKINGNSPTLKFERESSLSRCVSKHIFEFLKLSTAANASEVRNLLETTLKTIDIENTR